MGVILHCDQTVTFSAVWPFRKTKNMPFFTEINRLYFTDLQYAKIYFYNILKISAISLSILFIILHILHTLS